MGQVFNNDAHVFNKVCGGWDVICRGQATLVGKQWITDHLVGVRKGGLGKVVIVKRRDNSTTLIEIVFPHHAINHALSVVVRGITGDIHGVPFHVEYVVGNQQSRVGVLNTPRRPDVALHINRVVVNILVEGSEGRIAGTNVSAYPECVPGLPVVQGARPVGRLTLYPVAVIDTDVIPVCAIVVVPKDLDKAPAIVDTEVVLDNHVPAVEVDVDATGVGPATRVHERILLNQDPLTSPWPDPASAAVHAGIGIGTGSINDIAAHNQIVHATGLQGRTTDVR